MKLLNLNITNFLSFGENVNVDMENVKPPVLVQGVTKSADSSNGAGKSSLFEAFYWCLTGTLIRDISATEVIRTGQKHCAVSSKFEYNGTLMTVSREYSASKKRMTLSVDGKVEEFHDSKQGTVRLFEIMGVTPELLSLVCFNGRKFETFSKLKPGARADLIDMLAQGQKWEEARVLEAKKAKELSKELDAATAEKDAALTLHNKFNLQLQEKAVQLGKDKTAHELSLAETKESLQKAAQLTAENNAAMEQNKQALANIAQPTDLLNSITAMNEEIQILSNSVSESKAEVVKVQTAMTVLKAKESSGDTHLWSLQQTARENTAEKERKQRELAGLKLNLGGFENEKNSILNELDTGLCRSCGQKLPHNHNEEPLVDRLAQIEEQIIAATEQHNEKLKSLTEGIQQADALAVEIQGNIEAYNIERAAKSVAELAELETKFTEVNNKFIVEQAELHELQEYLSKLKQDAAQANEARVVLEKVVKDLETANLSLLHQENALKVKLTSLENNTSLAVLEREITMLTERVAEEVARMDTIMVKVKDIGDKLTLAKYWVQGFSDIRFSLFNGVVKTLEELLNTFCAQQGLDFDQIDIDTWKVKSDNKAKPEINLYVVRGGESVSIGALSEGETQRVDLACFFAIRALVEQSLGFKLHLAVLDEPLTGIDAAGKQLVFGIIDSLAEHNQVFVIDHDANFKSLFTNTITVIKNVTSSVSIA